MTGLYKGLRATTLAGQTGKIRRTQVINYVMKQGQYVVKEQLLNNNLYVELYIQDYKKSRTRSIKGV